MEAAVRHTYAWTNETMERPLIDPEWRNKPKYSEEEFWNMACVDLGKRYGLKDIREAAQ